jgi:hypothetical protein
MIEIHLFISSVSSVSSVAFHTDRINLSPFTKYFCVKSIKVSEFPKEFWNLFTLLKSCPVDHCELTKFRILLMRQERVLSKAASLTVCQDGLTKVGYVILFEASWHSHKERAKGTLLCLQFKYVYQVFSNTHLNIHCPTGDSSAISRCLFRTESFNFYLFEQHFDVKNGPSLVVIDNE